LEELEELGRRCQIRAKADRHIVGADPVFNLGQVHPDLHGLGATKKLLVGENPVEEFARDIMEKLSQDLYDNGGVNMIRV
jgi:hypothetical protein